MWSASPHRRGAGASTAGRFWSIDLHSHVLPGLDDGAETLTDSLQLAQANDVALVPSVLEKGIEWLKRYQAEQLTWLKDDIAGRTTSTPIVVFAHIPLWTVYEQWGWGTEDGARAIELMKRFGSVTVLNGHIHQVMQKVEGNVAFHTAMSTAFPQPAPGSAPSPGPLKVPDDKLRSLLGTTDVNFVRGQQRLAVIDKPLQN